MNNRQPSRLPDQHDNCKQVSNVVHLSLKEEVTNDNIYQTGKKKLGNSNVLNGGALAAPACWLIVEPSVPVR